MELIEVYPVMIMPEMERVQEDTSMFKNIAQVVFVELEHVQVVVVDIRLVQQVVVGIILALTQRVGVNHIILEQIVVSVVQPIIMNGFLKGVIIIWLLMLITVVLDIVDVLVAMVVEVTMAIGMQGALVIRV